MAQKMASKWRFTYYELFVFALMTFIIGATAHAQEAPGEFDNFFSLRPPPAFFHKKVHRYNYGISILGGEGKMGNGSFDAPSRDMQYTTIQGFTGFRVSYFRFSIAAEIMKAAQVDDALEFSNTNIGGLGFGYGPKIDFYDGRYSIGFIYKANNAYALDKKDINGVSQMYKANSGFNFQVSRRITPRYGVIIDYAQETFNDSLVTRNIKWDRISIGLIISNFDKSPFPIKY